MGLLWTILIGLLVGIAARFIYPREQPMGWIMTTLLGIGGALVASWGGQLLGLYKVGEPAGFIGALVGALILLFVYIKFVKKG
jgi:uncharacterized membrane protein YeaQ/YmgE (transglycosylase-associated protein family)